MKDDLMKQFEEYFIGTEGDEYHPTSLENYFADGSGVSPKTKQFESGRSR